MLDSVPSRPPTFFLRALKIVATGQTQIRLYKRRIFKKKKKMTFIVKREREREWKGEFMF